MTSDPAADRQSTNAVRRCINCDNDDGEKYFTFDHDFMLNVRRFQQETLERIGWGPETTSTIVRCRQCGCHYIRDVFVADQQQLAEPYSPERLKWILTNLQTQFSREFAKNLHFNDQIVSTLLRLVFKTTTGGNLSLLDFGSSSGTFSFIARARGFKTVVAYDTSFGSNIAEVMASSHPLGVIYARRKEELFAHGPYDVIVCQSADEHFFDLQGELRLMRELLSDRGILYLSHPIMELEKDIEDLRNEAKLTDKARVTGLRRRYHIDHLNYVLPRMFLNMLKKNGFKERHVLYYFPRFDVSPVHPLNLIPLSKAVVRYVMEWLQITYKRSIYFVEKA